MYVYIDQGKLKPRALKGVFVGYPAGVKSYKVWIPEDKKFIISRNAMFREDKLYKDIKRMILSRRREELRMKSM